MEKEQNDISTFLDSLVNRTNNGTLQTKVHRKPTNTTVNSPILPSNTYPKTQIFSTILANYGRAALHYARQWEVFSLRETSAYEQMRFLHNCILENFYPRSVSYKSPVNFDLETQTAEKFCKRMMHVSFQDCHLRIRKYKTAIDEYREKATEFIGEFHIRALGEGIEPNTQKRKIERRKALYE